MSLTGKSLTAPTDDEVTRSCRTFLAAAERNSGMDVNGRRWAAMKATLVEDRITQVEPTIMDFLHFIEAQGITLHKPGERLAMEGLDLSNLTRQFVAESEPSEWG